MFTQALLVGITVPELTHGTTIANLGFEEVRATRWHSVVCSRVLSYPSTSMLENVHRTAGHAEKIPETYVLRDLFVTGFW